MFAKIKNLLIFVTIAAVLTWVYLTYFRGGDEIPNLTVESGVAPVAGSGASPAAAGGEFLGVLLNVKNIRLDDSILSDPAFLSLRDSSITLVQDVAEGRPNPFAPFGAEGAATTLPQPAPVIAPPPAQ